MNVVFGPASNRGACGNRLTRSPPFSPVAVMTTLRALPCFEPSRAMEPSTVMTSPILSDERFQPLRVRTAGAPISKAQLVTLPLSVSFTSM
jgi:hypothetical protein